MITNNIVAIGIAIGCTALIYILFLALVFPLMRAQRQMKERWAQYGTNISPKWEKTSAKIDERRLKSLQKDNKLKALLSHPYPSLKMLEYLFYRSGVFPSMKWHLAAQVLSIIFTTETILLFYGTSINVAFIIGVTISLLSHYLILRFKESSWKKSFIKSFSVSLDIINRGLKSGMTLGRGIALVSEEVEDPVGSEFNYIASQLQIGITPDDALTEASARIGIDEFRFFSLALNIQREMGGSLSDVLGKLSEVIRERDRFRRKVWTLSAEGRATAMIVGSLPFFLAIMVEMISPGYIKFFFTDPKGKIMLWICGALSITGILVITRMMRVED